MALIEWGQNIIKDDGILCSINLDEGTEIDWHDWHGN